MKSGDEICGIQTLQSTPRHFDSSLLGYFINDECHFVELPKTLLVMDKLCKQVNLVDFLTLPNDNKQISGPKIVSLSLSSSEKIKGLSRMESRIRTALNDPDLRYLRDLYLDQWKKGFFKTYKPNDSLDRRSALMCSDVGDNIGIGSFDRKTWLSKYLSVLKLPNELHHSIQFKKDDVENIFLSLLREARTMKFEKFSERLPLKLPDGYNFTQSEVLNLFNRFAILIHGWWCIKSEFLYPPESISSFEGHAREIMIRSRDYAMAVFHLGGKLTSKFLMNLTNIHFKEAREILEWLGVRLPPQNDDLSRYWIFREPDNAFIER